MKRKEFLAELEEYLVGIPGDEKSEILQDYEEHFKVGKKKKRSEAEIVKSLGDPKEIAREMRRELSGSKSLELKSEAIETWVAIKKFSKHLLGGAKDKIGDVVNKDKKKRDDFWPKVILGGIIILILIVAINSFFFKLVFLAGVGYLLYDYFKNDRRGRGRKNFVEKGVKGSLMKSVKKTKDTGRTSTLRLVFSLAFNLLFFIWFWLTIFFSIIGLFIGGLSIVISGIAVLVFSVFTLVVHGNVVINNLLWSVLFSGVGLVILGGLFTSFSGWLIKLYFKATRFYLQLNSRFIRK